MHPPTAMHGDVQDVGPSQVQASHPASLLVSSSPALAPFLSLLSLFSSPSRFSFSGSFPVLPGFPSQ
eukprot:356027-Chlamydomonas_euryale.AAC.6